MTASLLVASNRGPVSFVPDPDGGLVARRGGSGGLVSAVSSAYERGRAQWVCAALTDHDRQAARATGGQVAPGVCMLEIDEVTFDRAYNRVANETLWFLAHLLFDTASAPAFGTRSRREWQAYRDYDDAFAASLAAQAAPGATVLVQDYHLMLTPRQLRERRPDLRIGHFSHTPWAPPEYFRLLPDEVARELLLGMLGADALGFHSPRWADAFARCCAEVLGADIEGAGSVCAGVVGTGAATAGAELGAVVHQGRRTRLSVHPLGVDAAALRARSAEPDVQARLPVLRELVGRCQLVLRVDRTELSKNIARGLAAFGELLRDEPRWRGEVVHLALAYPSRHDLPAYREYTGVVQRLAREVNEEFAADGWVPVQLEVRDDYARSLAAYSLADVLLVNPLRDGMNLVAKEGPALSTRGVSLVLSREAGAADELGEAAHLVNPFDVSQTAAALHAALATPVAQRLRDTERLARAATALPPTAWLDAQLAALA